MLRNRWPVLLVLGVLACGDDASENAGSTTLEIDVDTEIPYCAMTSAYGPDVPQPGRIAFHGSIVTVTSDCTYKTTSGWSCTASEQCESEYDLGGPNPLKYERTAKPAAIVLKSVAVAPECSVVEEDGPSITVTCPAPLTTDVVVTIESDGVTSGKRFTLTFDDRGACQSP